jgi:hypothetical protein
MFTPSSSQTYKCIHIRKHQRFLEGLGHALPSLHSTLSLQPKCLLLLALFTNTTAQALVSGWVKLSHIATQHTIEGLQAGCAHWLLTSPRVMRLWIIAPSKYASW